MKIKLQEYINYMARYLIPQYKLPELTKQVNRIRNKGAQVTFEIINPTISVDAETLGRNISINCAEIEVSGRYHVDGWTFVGTIEHASPENIIRLADTSFDGRIPERYRNAGRDCEHCHIRRDRNDTYLIYNEDNDDFKQVGRTCLKGYTGGLDAETCAGLASVIAEIARINAEAERGDFSDIERYGGVGQNGRYRMEIARKQAYRYVRDNGYTPGETGKAFSAALRNNPDLAMATEAEVNEVTEWLNNTRESDYIRNVRAVWNKDEYSFRDAGYITSAVQSFFSDRDRQQQLAAQQERNAATEYAGNVGDTVTFKVTEARVIYWRSGGPSFNASEYPVFRIVGDDSRVYIWGTTTISTIQAGSTITGKIKKLIERPNGEKQTELTRGKVEAPHIRPFARFFSN